MEFGIFSNGFRPHTTAQQTYEEDLQEIILADQLGFSVAFISEHHGEALYINRVDTLPVPELLMCKAAALTRQIRFGAAVKVIHLQHPLDIAIQAATTDHIIGNNRFIFGFGSGFSAPLFSDERGLSFEDRHARQAESLDLILKCWASESPFDYDGKFWKGRGIVATPKPLCHPHMPIATASDTEASIEMAGARGYILLRGHDPAEKFRRAASIYVRGANSTGKTNPLKNIYDARFIYVANTRAQALEDLRAAVALETEFQSRRGFLKMMRSQFKFELPKDELIRLEDLVEIGWYLVGTPDEIAEKLTKLYVASGGFGTLLMITGKNWADRERRMRSMRLFMEQVAPELRHLDPTRELETA